MRISFGFSYGGGGWKKLDCFLLPPTPYEKPNEILIDTRISFGFSYGWGGWNFFVFFLSPPFLYENLNENLIDTRISFGFSYGVGGRRKKSKFFFTPSPNENPYEILVTMRFSLGFSNGVGGEEKFGFFPYPPYPIREPKWESHPNSFFFSSSSSNNSNSCSYLIVFWKTLTLAIYHGCWIINSNTNSHFIFLGSFLKNTSPWTQSIEDLSSHIYIEQCIHIQELWSHWRLFQLMFL